MAMVTRSSQIYGIVLLIFVNFVSFIKQNGIKSISTQKLLSTGLGCRIRDHKGMFLKIGKLELNPNLSHLKYLFIDLGFKRPFFFTYAKSCMLSLFLLRYACVCTTINKSAKKSGKVRGC
jgi:hypothetical protein